MTAGALTVFLSYLNKFFKPVQDLATMTNTIAQAAVGVERIRAILDADDIIPEHPDAREPAQFRRDRVRACGLRLHAEAPVLKDVSFKIEAGPDGWSRRPDGLWQVHHRQPDSAILRPDLR